MAFVYAHSFWYFIILGSLAFVAFLAYHPSPIPFNPLVFLVEDIYHAHLIIQWIWKGAVLIHLGEAIYALYLARSVDKHNSFMWFIQTFLLGFPSLGLLLAQQKKRI